MYRIAQIGGDNQAWLDYFRTQRIEPYRNNYEALDANYREEAIRLLDWLGVRLGVRLGPLQRRRLTPVLRKQRDALNVEWEERFYRDLVHWYGEWEKLPIEQ